MILLFSTTFPQLSLSASFSQYIRKQLGLGCWPSLLQVARSVAAHLKQEAGPIPSLKTQRWWFWSSGPCLPAGNPQERRWLHPTSWGPRWTNPASGNSSFPPLLDVVEGTEQSHHWRKWQWMLIIGKPNILVFSAPLVLVKQVLPQIWQEFYRPRCKLCPCTLLSTYNLQSIAWYVTCKVSEGLAGFGYEKPHNTGSCLPGQGCKVSPFYQQHSQESTGGCQGSSLSFHSCLPLLHHLTAFYVNGSWINFESTNWVSLGFLVKSHSLNISATLTVLNMNSLGWSQGWRHRPRRLILTSTS